MDVSLASRRFSSALVGGFAAVALLLASIGIYGLLAYMVGQRSHEIGIRVALGAQPSTFSVDFAPRNALVRHGSLSWHHPRNRFRPMIASLLYGVRPLDLQVFLFVPVVFLVVAFLASSIPARRALRVDPIIALREN